MNFTEASVEDAALARLEALGCAVLHGPDFAPGEPSDAPSVIGPNRDVPWVVSRLAGLADRLTQVAGG